MKTVSFSMSERDLQSKLTKSSHKPHAATWNKILGIAGVLVITKARGSPSVVDVGRRHRRFVWYAIYSVTVR